MSFGAQSFEGLIRNEYVYVDKTEYVCVLVFSGKQFFLSRPMCFWTRSLPCLYSAFVL